MKYCLMKRREWKILALLLKKELKDRLKEGVVNNTLFVENQAPEVAEKLARIDFMAGSY